MKPDDFKSSDLVAVFGGEVGKEGEIADVVSICKVITVGEQDLIVEEVLKTTFSRSLTHTVPKSLCRKLTIDPSRLSQDQVLVPSPGDLVFSYTKESYGSRGSNEKAEEITGILYKTTYRLGKPHKCTLICGKEMKEVTFDSLLVLQSNTKLNLN